MNYQAVDAWEVNIRRKRLGPFFFLSFGCFSFSDTCVPALEVVLLGARLGALLGALLGAFDGALEDLLKNPDGPLATDWDSFLACRLEDR